MNGYHVYAMRKLNYDTILAILVKSVCTLGDDGVVKFMHETAENQENALIVSLDGTIIKRFRYYDFSGEMDYGLKINEECFTDTLLILDTDRQKLIFLERFPPYNMREIGIDELTQVTKETEEDFQYMKVVFETFIPSRYEIRLSDSGRYYYKLTSYFDYPKP